MATTYRRDLCTAERIATRTRATMALALVLLSMTVGVPPTPHADEGESATEKCEQFGCSS